MRKAIVFALLLLPIQAFAVRFDLGAGMTQYKQIANGTWIQAGNPGQMTLKSPAEKVGLSFGLPYRFRFRVAYVWLGTASEASWDTTDQAYAAGCRGSSCPGWANFVGSGEIQGVALTFARGIHFGPVEVVGDVGPFIYRPTWTESVYGTNGALVAQVSHNPKWDEGFTGGLSLRYGILGVSWQYYHARAAGDAVPALYHSAQTFMVTAHIPI